MEKILRKLFLKERKLFKGSYLFKKIMVADIALEGIVLHSPDIDQLSKFYIALLGIDLEEIKTRSRRKYGGRYYIGRMADGLSLSLHPGTQKITPTPSLVFAIEDLDSVIQRVKGYINDDVQEFSFGVGIHDPDGRAILLQKIG